MCSSHRKALNAMASGKLSKADQERLAFKERLAELEAVNRELASQFNPEEWAARQAEKDAMHRKKDPKTTIGFSGTWGTRTAVPERNPGASQSREYSEELRALAEDLSGWKEARAQEKKKRAREEAKAAAQEKRRKERQELYDRLGASLLYRPKGVEDL